MGHTQQTAPTSAATASAPPHAATAAVSAAPVAAKPAAPGLVPTDSASYVYRSLLAGGIAGCVAKTAVAPLDRVKILFQGSNPTVKHFAGSFFGGFRAIWWIGQEQGIRGIYKGHQATLLRIFPYAALNYMCYEQYKRALCRQQIYPLSCRSSTDLPPLARLMAGSAAGLTSVLFTYPLDYVHSRITYQVKMTRYTGIADTIRQTIQQDGFRGLYRGFGPTAMGIVPYAGMSFLTYDTLKHLAAEFFARKQFKEDVEAAMAAGTIPPSAPAATAHVPVPVRLLCGALAGAAAQTASYPLDVVRRRMQLYGLSSQLPLYRNTWHAFREIIRTEGFRRLYIGLSINYIKVGPAHAISFVTYEWCKHHLNIK
jgi:solute carrier family 25 protein 16